MINRQVHIAGLLIFCWIGYQCSGPEEQLNKFGEIHGIHLMGYHTDERLEKLSDQIPSLAKMGVNLIILEVNYNFDFQSHPELRANQYITSESATRIVDICKQHGVRLIPEFQTIGHQSWKDKTFPLLTAYPDFDITPGEFPNNEGIYCREWDPTNPAIYETIFPMIDEIVNAFKADGIHLGMDEIFLIGSDKSPNTYGKNPAEVLANSINRFHDYFVKKRGLEMFIWGDRLIDTNEYNQGSFESSTNGTSDAINLIPKDIIICDWHYYPQKEYPTANMFIESGFRVLPTSFRKRHAIAELIKYTYQIKDERMLGHLFTTWEFIDSLLVYPPVVLGMDIIKNKSFYDLNIDMNMTDRNNKEWKLRLSTELSQAKINYTTDAGIPSTRSPLFANSPLFAKPIKVSDNMIIKAQVFNNNKPIGKLLEKKIRIHKGLGSKINLITKTGWIHKTKSKEYILLNGLEGSEMFWDGQWLGFEQTDMQLLLNFGSKKEISSFSINCADSEGDSVYPAGYIELLTSTDGSSFSKLIDRKDFIFKPGVVTYSLQFESHYAQYLLVTAYRGTIPKGRPYGGRIGKLFVDELIIY